MGNCIRRESEAEWGGEDWGEVLMTNQEKSAIKMEEQAAKIVLGLSGNKKLEDYSSNTTTMLKTTEVKIKISRKKLEKLQGRFDEIEKQDGLSVQQALAQLIKLSSHYETQQRSWRPRLQTIPEF